MKQPQGLKPLHRPPAPPCRHTQRRDTRFLVALGTALLLQACGEEQPRVDVGGALCDAELTPISAIQGPGDRSPLAGQTVTARGMVTLLTERGLFIESLRGDGDPATSEGLFLEETRPEFRPEPGALVHARGSVAELGEQRDTQTALVNLETVTHCPLSIPGPTNDTRGPESGRNPGPGRSGHPGRPRTHVELPLQGEQREALENMRIALANRSLVTGVFRLRDGDFLIAAGSPLAIPTEVTWPGKDARRLRRQNRARSMPVRLAPGDAAVFAVGAELLSDRGVLGHDGRGLRLLLEKPAQVAPRRRPEPPVRADETPRLIALNLFNYFNGDGRGGGFPARRGADSAQAFEDQRRRLRATFERLEPDLLAVMELENDGFGQFSAAGDLREDLEAASGARWQVVAPSPNRVGSDEIAVGLFFRPDRFRPVGRPALLDAAPFDLLSRTPLAQAFEHAMSGQRFTVIVNHFKSKGSCPEQGADRDRNDGQGCWNAARTAAARALAPWVQELAAASEGRAVILGDLNAYRMEDPVRELIAAGFQDLTGSAGPGHRYSYVYRGESGTLDHALATPALASRVSLAQILNINSPFPPAVPLDSLEAGPWLRSSDHDPVLLEFRFSQAATSD